VYQKAKRAPGEGEEDFSDDDDAGNFEGCDDEDEKLQTQEIMQKIQAVADEEKKKKVKIRVAPELSDIVTIPSTKYVGLDPSNGN